METKNEKKTWHVIFDYEEHGKREFDVTTNSSEQETMWILCIITRGAITTSSAKRASAYDENGQPIVTYEL